ncbi:hypothetical protein HW555_010456 [Spodoptera exigua]|uniref:MADF domain-containing protein n=1 Tax=Spodoptera exigua TaxID=7107 RepID=A0A835G735_SPOEX|nr:hypothetical protein HW555_010456 [Spodoptera exigua]
MLANCMLCTDSRTARLNDGDYAGSGERGASLRPAPPNTLSDLRAAPLDERVTANNMSDSINVVFPRKLLKEFISLYQRQPCLWDKHCASYKMKHKRHEAITKLTQLVQLYDTSATRVHVLRKIESLRACVRREFKRVQNSKKTAENESDIYTPHLWYYDLFSFMFQAEEPSQEFEKTKEVAASPQSTSVDSEPEEPESMADEDTSFISPMEDNYTAFSISSVAGEAQEAAHSSKRFAEDDKNKRHCTEVDDEYDAIGVNVAAKLRNLPGNMRILAEKLINDVLYQAQTNGLTNATFISTPDPFKV